uniref:Uncharacterized protein n=1 Tax=Oryza glaberrima TaxID=4538 RepID=I1NME0_ORYGL
QLFHVVGDEVGVKADGERVLGELGGDELVDELGEAEHPGQAGGVDGVPQHLEEDSPGEEERDTRGIPLGGGGDGVGDEREEERGGRLDEEAEHRVAGAAAVGAEHDEEGK